MALLLTPLLVNVWVEQQFEASKIWFLRTLIWTSALLWLGGWMAGRKRRALPSTLVKLIAILSTIVLLSTLLSSNQYIAFFGSLDRAAGTLTQLSYLLFFFCVATHIDIQRCQLFLKVIIFTSLPICIIALAQWAGWQPLPVLTDGRSALTTTLGRSNFTGAYLVLLVPLTLAATKIADNFWGRFGYVALAILEFLVIFLCQARSSWIAAVVGVGVLVWLNLAPQWSKRDQWLSVTIALLSGAIVLLVVGTITYGGSIAARWTIWKASLHLLWTRLWLGYGADTLDLYFPSVYPPELVYYQGREISVDRAHNWLLDWSLNYGIVATVILIWMVYFIIRQGWLELLACRKAKNNSSKEKDFDQRWLAACMASIFAQLTGNLFLFEVVSTALVFWFLLAIVTGVTNTEENQSLSQVLWRRHLGMVTGLLIVCWAVWQCNFRPLLADLYVWHGTHALHMGAPQLALAEYSAAVDIQPKQAAYHAALAYTAKRVNELDRAERAMHNAISLRPSDPYLYNQLAAIYSSGIVEAEAKKSMAYAAYNTAITLGPTIALTYQRYADLALRSGDRLLALKLAQKAVGLDETDGISFGILGWCELHFGKPVEAQNSFQQAVKWRDESADFHLGLAISLFQQGNLKAAREALAQSLIIDPNYEPSLTLQRQLVRY